MCFVDNVFECNFNSNDCSNSVNINIGGSGILKWDRVNNGQTPSAETGPADGSGGILLIDPYIARTSKKEVKFKSLLYVLALIAVHSVGLADRA